MLVGVAPLPLNFLPSGTWAFYIINRPNCVNICNTVYMSHLLYNISSVTEHWRKTHMHMASRTTKRRETQGQAGVHAG